MSSLGRHLRSRVRYLEHRVRGGLVMRRDYKWLDVAEFMRPARTVTLLRDGQPVAVQLEKPAWLASPRRRFHHGIRKAIQKLRTARLHLNEFRRLQEAAQ